MAEITAIFSRPLAPETIEIAAILAAVTIGETIAYREISRIVGVDVIVRRHFLSSARRVVMRDNDAVFQSVRNVGLRRLSDIDTVTEIPGLRRRRIRTQSRNAIKEMGTVNYSMLPEAKKIEHNLGVAIFGTVHQATSSKAIHALEKKISNELIPDARETVKMMLSS